ncbi:MAG: sigma-70 family RNA polymerase sigma factor, partial [Candidatus Promineifilaceae bacterium]|nr:sigma-70 family RNA polymerase sigma factor [Candidatus Promineifilaceae bacterium]
MGLTLDYSQFDDNILLRLILDGETQALDALYNRYGRLVYTIALRVVGDQAISEEITLDVFTRVWEKAHTFQADRGKLRTWIAGMTRNRAIDVLRRSEVRQKVQRQVWAEAEMASGSFERNPEVSVHQQMRKELVREAIGQLSAEQRDVLALAYFQGYTQREIAELRDLPLGTVKTRVRSGIQKLRQLLREDDAPELNPGERP